MTRRIITALALIAIVFTLSACERTARTNAGRQSTKIQQPRTESSKRYARMWVKYQLCIGKLAKLPDPFAQQNLKQWRGYGRKADAEVRKRGSEILKELQARAKSNHLGKLDFEGECPERKYFSSASDASATLFGILYREGKVDPGYLADMLSQSHLPIADGWIPVLQDITAKAEPDSEAQRTAVRTLYSVGVGRDRYRPTLEKWARGLDPAAICTLLYDADRGLREYEIIKSPANHALVDDILKRKPRPGRQVICADYAVAAGNRKLAEEICTRILAMPFSGREQNLKSDSELCAVKLGFYRQGGALGVLFYKVRTERAFKQVWDRAEYVRVKKEEWGDLWEAGDYWHQQELDRASQMIRELEDFK